MLIAPSFKRSLVVEKFQGIYLNVRLIGKFRIPGQLRASACFRAKARLTRVTSWQDDKQTELPDNEENLILMFRWAPKLLIGLRNHCYVSQKKDQLLVTEKNSERNQKLSGRVGW